MVNTGINVDIQFSDGVLPNVRITEIEFDIPTGNQILTIVVPRGRTVIKKKRWWQIGITID